MVLERIEGLQSLPYDEMYSLCTQNKLTAEEVEAGVGIDVLVQTQLQQAGLDGGAPAGDA